MHAVRARGRGGARGDGRLGVRGCPGEGCGGVHCGPGVRGCRGCLWGGGAVLSGVRWWGGGSAPLCELLWDVWRGVLLSGVTVGGWGHTVAVGALWLVGGGCTVRSGALLPG